MVLTLTLASAGVVFSGEKSDWPLIVVRHTSAVNQTPDILEKIARFADIEEDEPILHPLCNECARLV